MSPEEFKECPISLGAGLAGGVGEAEESWKSELRDPKKAVVLPVLQLPATGPLEGTVVVLPLGLGMAPEMRFPAPERCWYISAGRQQVSDKCSNPQGDGGHDRQPSER